MIIFDCLYARIGIPHCPKCGKRNQEADCRSDGRPYYGTAGADETAAVWRRLSAVSKGTHAKLLEQAKKSGYVRVQIDGNLYELSEEIKLDKNIKHNIEVIVDRLVVKSGIEKRLSDSIETVLDLSDGLLMVDTMDGNIRDISVRVLHARIVRSVLMRLNREVFPSTIRSVHARTVLVWIQNGI